MNLPDLKKQAGVFLTENASTILTAGGVVGTVTTAVLTGHASYKAAEIIRVAELEHMIETEEEEPVELPGNGNNHESLGFTRFHKAKLVWPLFLPPVLTGSATVASIVMANRISAQRAAALAAAYGIAENRLQEYREKVAEKLTGPKKQTIDDEIAQKHVDENPPSQQVVIVAGGDVLCYDLMSGRYFRSSVEKIKRAESELNQELFDSQMASLSSFYDNLGIPRTLMSDILGWTAFVDGVVSITLSTTLSEDKQPCLVLDYSRMPEPNFTRIIE